MKLSYNQLLQYVSPEVPIAKILELLTNCGLEVEGTEKFESVKGGLNGLVTGLVVSKSQHPNADKLSLTKVDVGAGELLSIVCGAPNVEAGQKVIVAPVGITIFPLKGEPFTISKAKIRGEGSHGMICAEDEIGLGQSHDGILVLPNETKIGIPVKELFNITEDTIIEIGLTANRGDAASHLGTARDISALLDIPLHKPKVAKPVYSNALPVSVSVESRAQCPRYSGVYIQNVTVKDSPDWLKNFLKSIGLNPKNNIVDISNFVLHSVGQPLHAFDADKIKGNKIAIKPAQKDLKFDSLDGETRKLTGTELMIWDAEQPIAMAGVMGGQFSAVSEQTKNIFIESAYFDPGIVRKAAKLHALNTDSSFRFERGTDPQGTILGVELATQLVLEFAGGEVASALIDIVSNDHLPKDVDLPIRKSEIKKVCGIEISDEKVVAILSRLEIQILKTNAEGWQVSVPAFKSDVTREVDVIEEIIRIYGFDHIPLNEQMTISLPPQLSNTDKIINKKEKIAFYLRSHGFHEMQTNSLTKDKYFDPKKEDVISLKNPLSSDLGVMRQSLIPGALESVAYNQKRRAESILLFEFGKSYKKKEEAKYIETNLLCITASGNTKAESWEYKTRKADYFFLKSILAGLAQQLGVTEINEKCGLNFMGEPDKYWLQIADCKAPVVCAEINLDKLLGDSLRSKFTLQELPKYPSVRRDLSLVIDKEISFSQIIQIANKTERKYLTEIFVFDVFEGKPLPEDKKSYSIAFMLQDKEKTMSDKQIDDIMIRLISNFTKEIGADIRK